VRKVDERSRCFFDGMGIYFRGIICSRTLGNWYQIESWRHRHSDRLGFFSRTIALHAIFLYIKALSA
ncbi:hypothetical protein QUA82_19185, partial [Microcoleus sp. F8-D3]